MRAWLAAFAGGVLLSGCVTGQQDKPATGAAAPQAEIPVHRKTAAEQDGANLMVALVVCGDLDSGYRTAVAACTDLIESDRFTRKERAKFYAMRGAHHGTHDAIAAAISDFGRSIELDGTNPTTYAARADAFMQDGQSAAAEADASHAIEAGMKEASIFVTRGMARMDLDRFEGAVTDFDRAIARRNIDPAYFLVRALAYRRLYRFDRALDDLESAAALGFDKPDFHVLRAQTLNSLGRGAEAVAEYDRALAAGLADPMLVSGRGHAHLLAGDAAAAAADFARAEELAPDNPDIQNDIAWAYATAPEAVRYAAIARRHAMRARELEPENGFIVDTLAATYVAAGELDTAMALYDRAVEMEPKTVTMYQRYLRAHGYYDGPVDRQMSDALRRAMARFVRDACPLTTGFCPAAEGDGA